jgi:hypothetical protein
MPIVPAIPAISSPPTNLFGLAQYLAQRLPGYDFSEYVREINAAYIHVWEEISKLKNQYFTNAVTATVVPTAAQEFDLLYNADGNLSNAISSRLYQITRIRVLPPNSGFGTSGLWQTCTMLSYNDPDFVTIEAQASAQASTQTGPYYFIVHGHGRLRSAIPLASGTMLEVTYTYWPIALTYMTSNNPPSSVSSAGTAVTGTTTTFTQIVPPDFQATLPVASVVNEEAIQAEFICNSQVAAGGQVYRVAAIVSDTALSTLTAVVPVLAPGSQYVIATVPEIPREHIRVIASVALAKMFSVDGDDQRVTEWTAIAAQAMQMMKDSLVERQSNNPPKKQRFQYGVGRRNRAFLR